MPVDGFWSISLYNADGYFQKNDLNAYSLNNITSKKNADGSVGYPVRRLRRQDSELPADHARLELHGAALSPARRNLERHMEIPGAEPVSRVRARSSKFFRDRHGAGLWWFGRAGLKHLRKLTGVLHRRTRQVVSRAGPIALLIRLSPTPNSRKGICRYSRRPALGSQTMLEAVAIGDDRAT